MKDDLKGREQALTANASKVGDIVAQAAYGMSLAKGGEKAPLSDMNRVKDYAQAYLTECAEKGTLPTVRGCAARLGVTRNAFYDRAKRHPNSEFALWLEDFSDLCGEVMMQAALEGTVSPVPAIFIAKSRYHWREAPQQIEFGRIGQMGAEPDEYELRRRIAGDVVLDEDEVIDV